MVSEWKYHQFVGYFKETPNSREMNESFENWSLPQYGVEEQCVSGSVYPLKFYTKARRLAVCPLYFEPDFKYTIYDIHKESHATHLFFVKNKVQCIFEALHTNKRLI